MFALGGMLYLLPSGKVIGDIQASKAIRTLEHEVEEIEQYFENHELYRRIYFQSEGYKPVSPEEIQQVIDVPFPLFIFAGETLKFWSSRSYAFTESEIKLLSYSWNDISCLEGSGKSFFLVKKQIPLHQNDSIQLIGLAPLPYNFDVQRLNQTDNALIKNSIETKWLCPDTFDEKDKSRAKSIWAIIIGLGVLLFLRYLHLQAVEFTGKYGYAFTISFLIIAIFLLRFFGMLLGFPNFAQTSHVDEIGYTGEYFNSLASVLIDTGLMIWLVLFFSRYIPIRNHEDKKPTIRNALGILYYLSIIMGAVFISLIFKHLVTHSGIEIDFENVFNLSLKSYGAILAVLLQVAALFLFTHRIYNTIRKLNPSLERRLINLLIASLITLPLFLLSNVGISPFFFYLGLFIYLILFDVFTDHTPKTASWLFIWVFVLAGLASLTLFRYNLLNDKENRLSFAKEIAEWHLNSEINDSNDTQDQPDISQEESFLSPLNYRGAGKAFDYAVYQGETRKTFKGAYYEPLYSFKLKPGYGEHTTLHINNRSELIFRADKELTVVVGRRQLGMIKPLSLFSYLFALLSILVLLTALLNSQFRFLPEGLNFYLTTKPTLRKKIQFFVLSLIVISFIFIGVVTVLYFQNSSELYQLDMLNNKTLAITADVQNKIYETGDNYDAKSVISYLPYASNIHQSNILLYDAHGRLAWKSFDERIQDQHPPWLMDISAFNAIAHFGRNFIVTEREIGDTDYKASYIALRNNTGDRIGFLSVPLYAQAEFARNAVNDFMGTLLNVYIFLFLIAAAIAVGVTNSITRPLFAIRERLGEIKLGKVNEPLLWNHKDEIGDLIQEYNSMIEKLDESAQMMAMTERDMAWREMARQVAHEIKNPLTPMKLSIQHLKFAIDQKPENTKEIVDRVSKTLIQQIDSLSNIASEFSNFAKMPKTNNENVILNEVVTAAHDLFRKRNDMDINLYVPINDIEIFADKNHVLRILNNLLKNAIQAIPDSRRGKVDINLSVEGTHALIKISDNGTGIPKELEGKVFSPNFTTKSSGTGLGLAISVNLIDTMNGRIYFETVPDEGTDFYVQIPLLKKHPLEGPDRVAL
jgi:signal transduction histidine kinase